MFGHVLIIDPHSNRRIYLHACLRDTCRTATVADTFAEGAKHIQSSPPDVVIVADKLPGLDLPKFCRVLRSGTSTQLVRVIVAVDSESASARCAALMAGAEDVIDHNVSSQELQATLRSFQRRQQDWDALRSQAGQSLSQGFREDIVPFENVPSVVVIGRSRADSRVSSLMHQLGPSARFTKTHDAKPSRKAAADVYVLLEDAQLSETSDLLSLLRTDANSRYAAILYVRSPQSSGAMSPLDRGATECVGASASSDEIALRVKRLARQKSAEDRARKEIRELGDRAFLDGVTGVFNRHYADKYFLRQDRLFTQQRQSRAVIMVDIDRFKDVNDTHGHSVGDAVLRHIAQTLRANLRDGDMIAKFGGDEFVIALADIEKPEAQRIVDRLRQAVLENPKTIANGTTIRASVSLGLAHALAREPDVSVDLREKADRALYAAKAEGRNRWRMSA